MNHLKRAGSVCVVASILAVCPAAAHAWGHLGHQIVADVADRYLSDASRQEVRALLGHASMADVAGWPDSIRDDRPETAPWHYVNVPREGVAFDRQRDCPDGQCVTGQVERFAAMIADRSLPPAQRRDALKFLIHFVGDMHQPLHCGYASDRGGNEIRVTFFGRPAKLHEVWDTLLLERQRVTSGEYAEQLIADISEPDRDAWTGGTPWDWMAESMQLAAEQAYRSSRGERVRSGDRLGRAYCNAKIGVVDRQLARGGVRLAGLLNAVFSGPGVEAAGGSASRPATTPVER